MKNLVIVESPSKSKTIEKYLGGDYHVVSSKGHIRDLATSGKGGLGIDVDHDFEPTYKISSDKRAVVKELKDLAKKSDHVYLASDPDREGEAIAWHLANVLDLNMEEENRIIFNEITKNAVIAAFEHPRTIDQDLVKSQEARRMLDRIIGFKLSKLLQSKIKSKSAGRVQSVALRLIVERENEIRAFKSEEYWTLAANIEKDGKTFSASLNKIDGKKAELKTQEEVNAIIERCCKEFVVSSIEKKVRKKEARMPFITSTLQQEASTKLGFGAKKTMQIAQKLYEGLPLAGGVSEGLISYMRTDSTRLSEQFVKDAESYIEDTYGKDYRGRARQKNSENAQDAHEAIRPTSILNTPQRVKEYLTNDQYKLYKLIYARTLASLMAPSKSNVVNVQIVSDGCEFSANGSILTFDGYLKIYSDYETVKDEMLPVMEEQEVLKDVELEGKQHFTEPPLRYSEARLIKDLEEKGIGRPSTYAIIIDTLQARGYVSLERPSEGSKTKVFIPSEQGELTDTKLQEFFSGIINVSYTANMEHHLDEIAAGERNNIEEVRTFYNEFEPLLQNAYENMEKKELERTGDKCPDCGNDLVYRIGRFGKFISCINFPECRYTKGEDEDENAVEEVCPKCGSKMVTKKGRYGSFLACSNYPECKYIKSNKTKEEPEPTGELCPECGHELVRRKSRFGTTFVGCSNYPKCRYIKKEPKKEKAEQEDGSTAKKKTAKKTTKKVVKKAVKKTVKKEAADEEKDNG
ncbi:type I DNA topoisomerase [Erysipelotrichaceae bacterium AF15-26LB]|nr:type I DNA topoisomerase [[Clostridium] innocuum]MCR0349826.1 type I DNA topoisomerase [[Clostridium] innocuum]RJV83835.1 type I DNA topoisomerase [Erysipelotrichaceae bacterium AF15-26LB]RJV83980.1 type I DNA topoisomerase [Erysipelotrichaceae bacterium AF19-24AC]